MEFHMTLTERDTLRQLAERWMALAQQPVMAERRRQWTALKDLRAERPMVLFETATLEHYVADDELACTDPFLREVELAMRWKIRHVEEVGDDTVIEPCYTIDWAISSSGYGVENAITQATDSAGESHGYSYAHPIRTPDDLDRLQPRIWQVDKDRTLRECTQLGMLFGDLLPVVLRGTGCLYVGITSDVFRLIGNDNLLSWLYDEPEAMHRLMAYLRDDRLAYYQWLEAEKLLGLNVACGYIGSGSPGYTSALPQLDYAGTPRLQDLWVWMESQETTMISPAMFAEFFLPYMAEVANRFGLVYYGCCEPLHDRWDSISMAIPKVRAASISPWCDMPAIAEKLGSTCVFSRKPAPAPMSGDTPDWHALQQDIDATLASAKDCNLEFVFRDVYRINHDRPRLRQWVDLVRKRVGM